MTYKTIAPVIRAMLDSNQYDDRIRFRIVYDIEGREYELVGLPDWPAYKDALERGEYRLVFGMTGHELRQAYIEFNKVQGRLFDELRYPKSVETGEQPGRHAPLFHVRPFGDSGAVDGEDDADVGTGNSNGASEGGGDRHDASGY